MVGQIMVEINGVLVNFLESIGLARDLKAFA
jgi:hypothetical protein